MSNRMIDQSCTCRCRKSAFRLHGRPLFRFLCHCRICQTLYGQPFADAMVFRSEAITLPDDSSIEFNRYRSPPSLRRGVCESCRAPVVGLMGFAPVMQLAFVPSRNCPAQDELPEPSLHIFYHRRIADVSDPLPKVSGYWRSEWAFARRILSDWPNATSDA